MAARRRISSPVTLILGALLALLGIVVSAGQAWSAGIVPLVIGCALAYLGWRGGRVATIIFGHAAVVVGCYLFTWGLYLLPYSKPIPAHIVGRPLFWGMISIFGGICAIYHGFCNCVGRKATPSGACCPPDRRGA
jgi:hypothetical protein